MYDTFSYHDRFAWPLAGWFIGADLIPRQRPGSSAGQGRTLVLLSHNEKDLVGLLPGDAES
ncbi:hypothetical protein [Micromonospora trifolii]|uniref:hypothetical protein n=1 Tax=Micromonospora trifolii TaxID=2911208 RepID=UPI003CF4116E